MTEKEFHAAAREEEIRNLLIPIPLFIGAGVLLFMINSPYIYVQTLSGLLLLGGVIEVFRLVEKLRDHDK